MASNSFDRVIFNVREKPLSADWNRVQTQADYTIRSMLRELYVKRASTSSEAAVPATGFMGGGFLVSPQVVPSMVLTIRSGAGFMDVVTDSPVSIGGVVSLDDALPYKPMILLADTVFTVPPAPGADTRVDIIEVRPNRLVADPQTRLILDPSTGAFVPNTVSKSLAFTLDGSIGTVSSPALSTAAIGYKVGVAAGFPVEPSVTPGYVKIAAVRVTAGQTTITGDSIVDRRALLFPSGGPTCSIRYRLQWNSGTPIVTILDTVAPPGIVMAVARANVDGGAVQGASVVYAIGGEILGATVQANVHRQTLGSTPLIVNPNVRSAGSQQTGDYIETWTLSHIAAKAAFTPSPSFGQGQKCAAADLRTWGFTAGGAAVDNITDNTDVVLNAAFHLRY